MTGTTEVQYLHNAWHHSYYPFPPLLHVEEPPTNNVFGVRVGIPNIACSNERRHEEKGKSELFLSLSVSEENDKKKYQRTWVVNNQCVVVRTIADHKDKVVPLVHVCNNHSALLKVR